MSYSRRHFIGSCITGLAGVGRAQDAPIVRDTPFGVNYVPAHIPESTDADATQAILEAVALGSHVSYIWEWSSGDRGFHDAEQLTTACRSVGLKIVLQLSPMAIGSAVVPEDLPESSFRNPEVRSRYLADVRRMAELGPEYLLLATEVNMMYEVHPDEFEAFRRLFVEGYQIVKQVSPSTKVGVSYHMDMLFAFNQLRLLELMKPQDFVALTSYPSWLVSTGMYKSVSEIPLWYYKRLRLIIGKPIIFSELAWPTAGKSDLDSQLQFVERLPELMHGVEPELITWAMQHDVRHFQVRWLTEAQIRILLGWDVRAEDLFDELNTMGLLSWDGPPKPAWFKALQYPTRKK